MITGLYETHIGVRDLEAAMRFYEEVVGLQLGAIDETRRIAFYFIGGWNNAMLGLWEKPEEQIQTQHYAFEVALADLDGAIAELKKQGVPTHNFFGECTEVPTVFGWMPAVSIYFKDSDGHELEYLAKLDGDPQPERGVVPWTEWNA